MTSSLQSVTFKDCPSKKFPTLGRNFSITEVLERLVKVGKTVKGGRDRCDCLKGSFPDKTEERKIVLAHSSSLAAEEDNTLTADSATKGEALAQLAKVESTAHVAKFTKNVSRQKQTLAKRRAELDEYVLLEVAKAQKEKRIELANIVADAAGRDARTARADLDDFDARVREQNERRGGDEKWNAGISAIWRDQRGGQ